MTKDSHKILISTTLLFWLAMMFAPALMAEDAWQQVDHPTLDFLYLNSNATNQSYENVELNSVSVWYPDVSRTANSSIESLRVRTESLVRSALADDGFSIVSGGDQNAIAINIQLIDLRAYSTNDVAPSWAANYGFRVLPGRVTLVAELFDAKTGQVLVRMADLQDSAMHLEAPELAVDLALEQWGDLIAASIRNLPATTQMAELVSR